MAGRACYRLDLMSGCPVISVIVPAYNAARWIGACVEALTHQTVVPSSYEVIVVDDGSTDATAEVAERMGARVVVTSHAGPATARNRGLASAAGDLILFTDADCVPAGDWIERMTAPLSRGADGVKGAYLTRQTGLLPRFIQAEFEERYRRLARFERIDFVDTYSAGYRREALQASGGFDAGFALPSAEDVDLSFRLANHGYHLVFEPSARVYHRHVDNLRSYLARKFRFGVYRVVVYRRFPRKVVADSYTPRIMLVEMGLAALILACLAGSLASPRLLRVGVLLGLAHLAATIPFATRVARSHPAVGAAAPGLIFLRSTAQICGIAVGIGRVLTSWLARSWR